MELLHAEATRMDRLDRENRELREELRKRHEQQRIMEQIVGNVSSLLDGTTEPMCIFDKEGFFLHINSACRRLLGIMDGQHSTRLTIFEFYSPWDRDRVMREFLSKPTHKWSGIVQLSNNGGIMQTIEPILSKHHAEPSFFKSYFTPQHLELSEKIRVYSDMIQHMPHGVGIWRLERGNTSPAVMRLVCANKLASQNVGVPLLPGSLIHEVLPSSQGIEVHRFLEDVVRSQRVITLDSFRIGLHSFSVTAYPLYPDFVAVTLDPPKSPTPPPPSPSHPQQKEEKEWVQILGASGTGVAVCDSSHIVSVNEHFAAMLGVPPAYLSGRDLLAVLETRARTGVRGCVEMMRRAVRERGAYSGEIEMEHAAWRVSVQTMGDSRHTIFLSHRTRSLPPPPSQHRAMFPIFPTSASSPSPSPSPSDKLFSSSSSESAIFKDLMDHIPSGIVVVKREEDGGEGLRIIAANHAARSSLPPFSSSSLLPHSSPFDPSFFRAVYACVKTQEGRVAQIEGNRARLVPLSDSVHVAVLFDDSSSDASALFELSKPTKRTLVELAEEVDRGYPIFPNHPPAKYMRPQEERERERSDLPFSKSTFPPILPPLQHPFSSSSSSTSSSSSSTNSLRGEKLERLFQHCIVGVACLDMSGAITMANKTFSQMLGYQEQELQQPSHLPPSSTPPPQQNSSSSLQHIVEMVHSEEGSQVRGLLRQLASGELHSLDVPLRFLHKSSRASVWGVASFIAIEKGILLQVLQPTKLKHFPEVLMSDRDVLRVAFREMVVGSAILDIEENPRIVSANSGFCAIMASTEENLSIRPLLSFLHPEDHEGVIEVMRDVVSGRTMRSQLLSVRSNPKSGPSRYGALSLSAILDSKSRPFQMIAQLQLVDKPFS